MSHDVRPADGTPAGPATSDLPGPARQPSLPDGYRLVRLTDERRRELYEVDLWAFPSGDSVDDLAEHPSPSPGTGPGASRPTAPTRAPSPSTAPCRT
ncbi:hypothetical protein [Paraoerskovia sediminicola]|uniref:hypothetical protein n=1 Tax=Paraoerskovia sediminicola TaxID=1138587 RepID=UPI0025737CFB|nr:hypothetical protein [Paraoerskovia sediminicola]